MSDSENEFNEKVLVLPVNEKSKKIRQILSNETSVRIISELQEKSMSATDLSEILSIPLNTILYNLNILVENELVSIKEIKFSEKGREIKIYEAPQKAIIFVPETSSKSSLIALIKQYASVLVMALGFGFCFQYLYRYFLYEKGGVFGTLEDKTTYESVSDELVMKGVEPESQILGTKGAFDIHSLLADIEYFLYDLFSYELTWFISGALFTVIVLLIIFKIKDAKKNKDTKKNKI